MTVNQKKKSIDFFRSFQGVCTFSISLCFYPILLTCGAILDQLLALEYSCRSKEKFLI